VNGSEQPSLAHRRDLLQRACGSRRQLSRPATPRLTQSTLGSVCARYTATISAARRRSIDNATRAIWAAHVSSAPALPPDDSPFEAVTLPFYATEAPTYAASSPDGSSRFLKPFLSMLPPQAYILELGCGGGRDVAGMLTAGFRVDATEGVPEVAGEAEKASRLPGARNAIRRARCSRNL
jgi:hypothetical protein